MNNYDEFIGYLINELSSVESSINWDKALNPDEYIDDYNNAAIWLVDPQEVPAKYETGFNQYLTLMENDMECWANNIRVLTESENWYKLAKTIITYGY